MATAVSEVNDVSGALNIYGDLRRGGAGGDIAAGGTAARLGANQGWFGETSGQIGAGATDVLGGLEVVQGLQRGGVSGYGEAAVGAGRLGIGTGLIDASSAAGRAIPIAGAALSVYNFAENWRSGATGSDTLQGAETGASIGSLVGPEGTLIGAGIGAAAGAISSLFGPGRQDPETVNWDQYAQAYQHGGAAAVSGASPAQNFQMLAGIFDARGSNIPFYGKYGRMGENRFFADMTNEINQAVKSGRVAPNSSPGTIYATVVEPWITAMGGSQGWQNTSTVQGAPEKQAIGAMLTNLIGQYQAGEINSSTKLGIAGQTVPVQPYVGAGMAAPVPAGHVASNKSPSAVSSAPGATMASPRQYQVNDPAMELGTPPMTGSGGSTSPTGTASPATSPVADLFGAPTAGDPWSGLGTYAALGGLGIYGASQAAKTNSGLISPAMAAGDVFTGAGETLLNRGMTGTLTPLQGQALSTSQTQGQTLINAATPVGQIAQGLFQQYQSGQLKPGDQAQLDQQVAAAKAQIIQQLGPNVDSTTAQTYLDQIDQQALITKNSMLNSYLSTGNTQFDQWAQTTEAGQKTIRDGQQYAITNIDQNFQDAFGAGGLGSNFMLTAIQTALQSNTQLANALGSYMGNLAKSYALAKGAGLASAAAGAAGAMGGPSGTDLTAMNKQGASDVNAAVAPQLSSDINTEFQSNFAANNPALPSGSVSVGQPGGTDVNSIISGPSFSDTGLGSFSTGYDNFAGTM